MMKRSIASVLDGQTRTPVLAVAFICMLALISTAVGAQQKKRDAQPLDPAAALEEARNLEAVIATPLGTIRIEFFPDAAPRHVSSFIRLAREGFYDGSAFHRVIERGIIQGGDPLLKTPSTPRDQWGSGGLNQLPDEFSDIRHIQGTVSTVRVPGRKDSGGAQFFICVSPQPQLDREFSAFGRVTEGISVVEKISLVEADDNQLAESPVRIESIRIESKKVEPFKDSPLHELKREVLLRTSLGEIIVEMDPGLAPDHVRNFLRLVETGWYDGTGFHRIVPGFVVQGGLASTREPDKSHPADRWVRPLKAEFTNTRHVRGILSMARASDPDSATTSFFIVLGNASHLNGRYTVFGRVISGFDTMELIEQVARDGETPRERIVLIEAAIRP